MTTPPTSDSFKISPKNESRPGLPDSEEASLPLVRQEFSHSLDETINTLFKSASAQNSHHSTAVIEESLFVHLTAEITESAAHRVSKRSNFLTRITSLFSTLSRNSCKPFLFIFFPEALI